MLRVAIACVIAGTGCGRVAFDARGDAAVTGGEVIADATPPDFIEFPMDDDPVVSQTLTGVPAFATVACVPPMCPVGTANHMVGSGGYHFDGTLRVTLGSLLPDTGPYTLAVWIDADPGLSFGAALSEPLDPTSGFDDVSLTVNTISASFEGTQNNMPVGANFTIDVRGVWHHVAMVFDGADRQLFLDGVFAGTGTGPWQTGTQPLAIGADLDSGSFAVPYIGDLDNLRIYRRALSPAEISVVFALR